MRFNTGLQTAADKCVAYAVVLRDAVVSREKIVLASQDNGANGIFDPIVVDLVISLLAISADTWPHTESITDGFAERTFGRTFTYGGFHPFFHLAEYGICFAEPFQTFVLRAPYNQKEELPVCLRVCCKWHNRQLESSSYNYCVY